MTDDRQPSAAAKFKTMHAKVEDRHLAAVGYLWSSFDLNRPEMAAQYLADFEQAGAAAERERICQWAQNDDGDWASICGAQDVYVEDDKLTPFCPYCGGKIVCREEK